MMTNFAFTHKSTSTRFYRIKSKIDRLLSLFIHFSSIRVRIIYEPKHKSENLIQLIVHTLGLRVMWIIHLNTIWIHTLHMASYAKTLLVVNLLCLNWLGIHFMVAFAVNVKISFVMLSSQQVKWEQDPIDTSKQWIYSSNESTSHLIQLKRSVLEIRVRCKANSKYRVFFRFMIQFYLLRILNVIPKLFLKIKPWLSFLHFKV